MWGKCVVGLKVYAMLGEREKCGDGEAQVNQNERIWMLMFEAKRKR